ncbi:hypothetical protein L2E82_19326 [Cichorium intybus]|uniref:Uncharacterized protein n=1 Tax=Cichorium intybus TaxID=13427 RepID=A0ACB9FCF6_CICIN|nr:hypothetical protein L2E82_19326 [Cichorium intybus]
MEVGCSEDDEDDEGEDDDDEEEDENEVEQDGISATDVMFNDGLEDGEIPPEEPYGEAPMTNTEHEKSRVGESQELPVNDCLGIPTDDVNVACLSNARVLKDTTLSGGRSLVENLGLNVWTGLTQAFETNGPTQCPSPQLEENVRVIRRKINRTNARFNPYGAPPSTSNQNPPQPVISSPTLNPNPTPSIDLNRNATCSDESSTPQLTRWLQLHWWVNRLDSTWMLIVRP